MRPFLPTCRTCCCPRPTLLPCSRSCLPQVSDKLVEIMRSIHRACKEAAEEYNTSLAGGANIAAFIKVRSMPGHVMMRGGLQGQPRPLTLAACP